MSSRPPNGAKGLAQFLSTIEKERRTNRYSRQNQKISSKSSQQLRPEKKQKMNMTYTQATLKLPQTSQQIVHEKKNELCRKQDTMRPPQLTAFKKKGACLAQKQIECKVVQIKQEQEVTDIDITFTDVNGKVWNPFKVPINFKGKDLSEFIFKNVTDELEVKRMKLCVDHFDLESQNNLSDFIPKEKGPKSCNIIQSRVDVLLVSKLKVTQQECIISLEANSVELEGCGHRIGSNALRGLIKSSLKMGSCSIYCPHKGGDGVSCPTEIDWDKCKRIGVLTKTEIQQLEEGLSRNYMGINMKNCPFCQGAISKEDIQSNRVGCIYPTCPGKKYDFCYLCLKEWKSDNFDTCGNEDCLFKNEWLYKAPTKTFKLKDKDGNESQYEVPSTRACPRCKTVVEHTSGCKHMKCKTCNERQFCFVCLSLADQRGKFPCLGYNAYCGSVAPIQKW